MSKEKPSKLEKAVEAFGELPADVAALGKPMSVHPPSRVARFSARWGAKLGAGPANTPAMRRLAAALAIGLPVVGALFLIPYFNGVAFGKAPPDGWLIFLVSGAVFGLASGLWWWHLRRSLGKDAPPPPDPGRAMPGVILYPDAMVHVCDGAFSVIRWADVETLESPAGKAVWRIIAGDGRQIDLPGWIEDDGTAIETMVNQVTAVLIPQFLERIEAGKKIMFGQFGVSKKSVYWKTKKTGWKDVTSMRIISGSRYCLQIFCGGFLPWCTFYMLTAPNGQLVYELLRRVAPTRLLKPA